MSPVGAGWSLEAEEGARLLVDPSLAFQVAPRVLHVLLNHTAWERGECYPIQGFQPENPDPSSAKVAISNSRTVGVSSALLCAIPVT